MSTPLVSVVVPTRNSAAVLKAALHSLACQTYRDFEVVVSDGASTDATVAIAQEAASALPALHIDSRPDAGVYDAINRGVRLTRGQWFLVLGSDDCLHAADTLAQAAKALQQEQQAQLVYGDVRMMAANACLVAPGGRYAGPVNLLRLFSTNICQQSIFYRRELFDTLGGFDLRYELYADWHFNLRAAFLMPTLWMDLVIADYAATGLSAAATDQRFYDDMPALIRGQLSLHKQRRDLWPAQRHLLRDADRLRRRGQWQKAFSVLGDYLGLLWSRLPVLIKGGR